MTDAQVSRRSPNPLKAFLLSLLFSSIGLATLLVGDRGTEAWRKAQEDSRELKAEIARLEKENAVLSSRIRDSGAGTLELEKNAREKLGLVKADEVVFVLPEEKAQTPKR